MDIVKPPTDNLYKFAAITGLLVAAASYYLPSSYEYEFRLAERDGMKEAAAAVCEYETLVMLAGGFEAFKRAQDAKGDNRPPYMITDDKGVRAQWRSIFKTETETLLQISVFPKAGSETDREFWMEQIGISKDAYDKVLEQQASGEANTELDHIVMGAAALRPKLLRAQIEVHKLWDMMDSMNKRWSMGRWGMGLGLVVGACGFIAWYRRVQRHQDTLLREEVKKSLARSQVEANGNS
jgi:hypothetical protein